MRSQHTINRQALVRRHNVVQRSLDARSPVSVGNGEFCFTVDLTGLQTLPAEYPVGARSELPPERCSARSPSGAGTPSPRPSSTAWPAPPSSMTPRAARSPTWTWWATSWTAVKPKPPAPKHGSRPTRTAWTWAGSGSRGRTQMRRRAATAAHAGRHHRPRPDPQPLDRNSHQHFPPPRPSRQGHHRLPSGPGPDWPHRGIPGPPARAGDDLRLPLWVRRMARRRRLEPPRCPHHHPGGTRRRTAQRCDRGPRPGRIGLPGHSLRTRPPAGPVRPARSATSRRIRTGRS